MKCVAMHETLSPKTKHLRFDIDSKINLHTGAMLAPNVARALSLPMMSAHGEEFLEIYHATQQMLQAIMKTKSTVMITMGTTTLALDWSISSMVEPGERVLTVVNGDGIFTERVRSILEFYGGRSILVRSLAEKPVDPAEVERVLRKDRDITTILCCHVESNYGTCNPIDAIGRLAEEYGKFFVVDAAPSVGGMHVNCDDWGIDVCVTSSFKSLGGPMGTPIIAVSDRAWEKMRNRRTPARNYHNLLTWKKYFVDAEGKSIDGDPAPSMAVNNVCALHEAIRSIVEDGVEETIRLHEYASRATREGIKAMGLRVFPECSSCPGCDSAERFCADALTVVKYPESVNEDTFRNKTLSEKYDVITSGGLGDLRGKVFRIGHMGKPQVLPRTILAAVSAVESSMAELGVSVKRGEGTKKAAEILGQL